MFLPAKSHIESFNLSPFGKDLFPDILRDDLIHPIVSGNKWRKLKYILSNAIETGKKTLVTFGGAYSNHVVATAYTAKAFGLNSYAFIRGDESRETNQYENICIENGMILQHVSRLDYRDKFKLFEIHFGDNPSALFIDEGGDHPDAFIGCSEILDEISLPYDYIILSVGSGTTMEGLLKGILKKRISTRVIGISSLKNNHALDKRMSNYPESIWEIQHDYHRGGYGKMDDELKSFIHMFFIKTGIKLDPVYTGKMMMAFVDLYQKNKFPKDSRILLIHTGGILSFPQ